MRRAPLRAAAVLSFAPLISGCAARMPARVIDVHEHWSFAEGAGGGGTDAASQALSAEWERAGIVGAVVHLPSGTSQPAGPEPSARFCAGVGEEPDLAALEAALAQGAVSCLKVYLGYVHLYPDDARYRQVYELAERFRVPVVFHTGDTSTADALLKYADPLLVDEVAVEHRGVTFVIAHCGNPWLASAAEVAYKNPNVYLECSALMTGNMDELPRATVDRYVTDAISYVLGYVEDPSKLMFGSDWPLVDLPAYVRAYARAVPREHWEAVFYGNAVRVFGFGGGE